MKRDAYGRLDENAYPSVHRVGPHSPATPWAMNLADEHGFFRVLCFDFDGKIKGEVDDDLMEQAQDQCDALSGMLDNLSIAHVVCQSSGTGGRHIWVTLRDGAAAERIKALSGAAENNFHTLDHGMLNNKVTGSARPPLSPHRDGSSSTVLWGDLDALTANTTTLDDLDALTAALNKRKPALRAADSAPTGQVSEHHRAHRTLSRAGAAHMATIGGGSNPSWTGFACLLSAANAGWTLGDVEHAAKSAPGMEHYRTKNNGRGSRHTRSTGEARARLERQWAKALEYAAVQRPLPASREPADLITRDTEAVLAKGYK